MISYHSNGNGYSCPDGNARWRYYGIGGTPYVQIDGSWHQEVGGIAYPGSMYSYYRAHFDTRKATSSPLTIDLTSSYDSIGNTGSITATVTNTTTSPVSGTLQFVITEDGIPQVWGPGLTTLEHVCRDMLPDSSGEAVTVPASGNVVKSRNFTISSGWNEKKICLVVFFQSSAKEVIQARQLFLMPTADMEYYGLTFIETSGNGNRVAQPGEAIRMYIKGINRGTGTYTGPASISTTDPYITITGSTPQTVSINPAAWDTVLVSNFNISASCPTPRLVNFLLTFATGDTNRINFMITNTPGFADDIESGQGSWVHSGTNDGWHITTHRSHSATHSWYSGVENTWQYTNNNDASLVTPYFVVTPDSNFKFWYWDSLELGYDYGNVDIDNNSGIWTNLATYNAGHLTFTLASLAVSSYSGQTVRVRFRFTSDGSVVAEGWYVDDVQMPVTPIGIYENQSGSTNRALAVSPNPFRTIARISVGQDLKPTGLRIFDISGRLVKNLSSGLSNASREVSWNGTDESGRSVPAGLYFVQLDLNGEKLNEKVLLLK